MSWTRNSASMQSSNPCGARCQRLNLVALLHVATGAYEDAAQTLYTQQAATEQSNNKSINNQSINQLSNQPIDQSNYQSISQSIRWGLLPASAPGRVASRCTPMAPEDEVGTRHAADHHSNQIDHSITQ
jgi:hypothetical protein